MSLLATMHAGKSARRRSSFSAAANLENVGKERSGGILDSVLGIGEDEEYD